MDSEAILREILEQSLAGGMARDFNNVPGDKKLTSRAGECAGNHREA